jgi:hypothetical protein
LNGLFGPELEEGFLVCVSFSFGTEARSLFFGLEQTILVLSHPMTIRL